MTKKIGISITLLFMVMFQFTFVDLHAKENDELIQQGDLL